MNVLILGSGGREHAIAWKLSKSPLLTKLYTAPGNAGTHDLGENIKIGSDDFNAIKDFVITANINMVIVGPEIPLVDGIYDYFQQDEKLKNIPVIGPSKKAALLEGSKDFAKEFMEKFNIPTARYKTFDITNLSEAPEFLKTMNPPYVLKADGLAAGKGVLIIDSFEEAIHQLDEMIEKSKFGEASRKVVIEEFL